MGSEVAGEPEVVVFGEDLAAWRSSCILLPVRCALFELKILLESRWLEAKLTACLVIPFKARMTVGKQYRRYIISSCWLLANPLLLLIRGVLP